MKALITEGIVLSRTNFGEADRILTILTPDQGKLRLIAKGVRKIKSKLAGGVELFSISELSYLSGKNDIGTLVSSRLKTHYGHIIEDIERVQLGYDLLKTVNKITEDHPEEIYFELLTEAFASLDDSKIDIKLIQIWFSCQLLKVNGHAPNLVSDEEGKKLDANKKYGFDFDHMSFVLSNRSEYSADHIKLLRLLFSHHSPEDISKIEDIDKVLVGLERLVERIAVLHLPHIRT